jgi:serine/threonine protein kinase
VGAREPGILSAGAPSGISIDEDDVVMSETLMTKEAAASRPDGVPFGKYVLLRRIALGGMAEVYLAALRGPDRFEKQLVIKRGHPHLTEQPEFSVMFSNEARIAAQLTHPNIAQVYEYGIVDHSAYLAMEFVDGPSLDKLTKHAAKKGAVLGPGIAAAIGAQVCEALQYAHDLHGPDGQWMGLVHRDVTPSNVMLARDGTVKLLDFGIAKITQGPSATQAGTLKGKLAYLAPEQLTGSVDRRADLFALGVALYEVAVGRRLFKRSSEAATITAVLQGDIPPPSDLTPGFPPAFEAILERALERDPRKRYATAQEMGDALERFAREAGIGRRELARMVAEHGTLEEAGKTASTPPDRPSLPSTSGLIRSRTGSENDDQDPLPTVADSSVSDGEREVDLMWAIFAGTGAVLSAIALWWIVLG